MSSPVAVKFCKNFISHYLRVSRYFQSTLFICNPVTNQLSLDKSTSRYHQFYRIRWYFSCLFLLIGIVQTIQFHQRNAEVNKSDTATLLQLSFLFASRSSFCLVTSSHIRKRKEMANLHNATLKLEKQFRALCGIRLHQMNNLETRGHDHQGFKTCKFVLWYAAINIVIVLTGRFCFGLKFPCFPDVAGTILVRECDLHGRMVDQISDAVAVAIKVSIAVIDWVVVSLLYLELNAELICFSYIPCFIISLVISRFRR